MLALACYAALGAIVSSQPPGPLDRLAEPLAGRALPLALVAYRSGLLPAYVAVYVLAIAFALIVPRWRGRVVFGAAALLTTWFVSDLFKAAFHRPRPAHWLVVHETSWSYASGHAALSLVVYGLWAYFLWRTPLALPIRVLLSGTLGLWCLIVAWSRLAMGAHYPTDVAGGWLLGITMLAGLSALAGLRR